MPSATQNWARVAAGVFFGISVAIFVGALSSPLIGAVIGWDTMALCHLVLIYWRLARVDEYTLARRAAEIDQGRRVLTALFVAAAVASLGGIAVMVRGGQDLGSLALASVTILISWILMHTVFAAHYAHRYFQSHQGLIFPGDSAPRFGEFVYFAMTVGMTYQVSDVTTNSQAMRRLVLSHAVIAFGFNTVIIAITVGLVASLI
jgi:uncharacterized membrane protein